MNTTTSSTAAGANARHVASAGSRSSRHHPTAHTGTSSGLTSTSRNGGKRYHGWLLAEPPAAIDAAIATIGKPCVTCQTRFGAHSASATAPPSHGHRAANALRGPTANTPTSSAASRNAGCSLFSSPTPATAPTASHTGPPSRSARTTSHDSSAQTNTSSVVVDSRCPVASRNDDTAADAAAITCARRPPPNSAASSPVSTTTSPAISADGVRSPTSEPPVTASRACASSGVSGGWSTYPNAGAPPTRTKYISSRCGP